MASKKIKKLYFSVNSEGGSIIPKFLHKEKKQDFGFQDIELLRTILTNEKSRILYVLKTQKPSSIYALAKLVKRDFKSVYQDLKVLERFGLIEFYAEKKGDRESLKPVLKVGEIQLIIEI